MPMKTTSRVVLLLACMLAGIAACQRTPPAPAPPAAVAKPPVQPEPPAESPPASEPSPTPRDVVENWVLPGDLAPSTTRMALEARFGAANVHVETFAMPEGAGSYSALVVFPGDPRKRLEVVQDADNPDAPIVELRVADPASSWHLPMGLRPGMTLAELVELNGAPVSFYGLDWDYGGGVQDWHGGKLANAVDASTFHRVTLAARKDLGDARLPQGDASFRSDDIAYPTIGKDLVVGELGISWPHEGED